MSSSVDAARVAVSSAATASLAPLLTTQFASVESVLAQQAALQSRLTALLAGAFTTTQFDPRAVGPLEFSLRDHLPTPPTFNSELTTAQAAHSSAPEAEMLACASKIEALRRRLEQVAQTMSRVQARLDALQDSVTKFVTASA